MDSSYADTGHLDKCSIEQSVWKISFKMADRGWFQQVASRNPERFPECDDVTAIARDWWKGAGSHICRPPTGEDPSISPSFHHICCTKILVQQQLCQNFQATTVLVPNFLPLLNTCFTLKSTILWLNSTCHLNLLLHSNVCSSEVSVSFYISIEITINWAIHSYHPFATIFFWRNHPFALNVHWNFQHRSRFAPHVDESVFFPNGCRPSLHHYWWAWWLSTGHGSILLQKFFLVYTPITCQVLPLLPCSKTLIHSQ